MKLTSLLTAGAMIAAMGASNAKAQTPVSDSMTPENKKQIEQVVHDYLVKNPDVLIEASQALQAKQQQVMQQQAKSAIAQNTNQLLSGKYAVAGNAKGNVTLVEFFDYQCSHCKHMSPIIEDLVKKDSNLRVVYKEFPIFGKESELASKVAIAAAMQGKYMALQEALLKADRRLDEQQIMTLAKNVGLDMTKLKTDMDSKAVADELSTNRQLAEKLHLMGTPAFIVLSTPRGEFKAGSDVAFVPGAASKESLQALISKAAGQSS